MSPIHPDSEGKVGELRATVQRARLSWEPDTTSMSRLPRERFVRRLGAVPPPGVTLAQLVERAQALRAREMAERAGAGLPASFDLRDVGGKNYITPIKDQGDCGSCVAFGTCAAIEGQVRRGLDQPDRDVDLSEAHLFHCHGRAAGRSCATGWIPDDALRYCKSDGIADEACYPYTDADQNCTGRCSDWQQRAHKVTDFHVVASPADAKQWLVQQGPLTACFVVYDDFPYYKTGVYRMTQGAQQLGGHCVTIIGYDDNAGCWICKNSWGTGWGDGGFFRIGYGECAIDSWQLCAIDGVTLPQDQEPEREGVWRKNTRVQGLWSLDEERNAWVYAKDVGWRRIASADDATFATLLVEMSMAKAAARPVDLLDKDGIITQAYVL
jgi:C1A family cysteine protease